MTLKNPYAARDRLDDEHVADFIAHADRAGTPHTQAVARVLVRLRAERDHLAEVVRDGYAVVVEARRAVMELDVLRRAAREALVELPLESPARALIVSALTATSLTERNDP